MPYVGARGTRQSHTAGGRGEAAPQASGLGVSGGKVHVARVSAQLHASRQARRCASAWVGKVRATVGVGREIKIARRGVER